MYFVLDTARWRRGNAAVCKTAMRGFESLPGLRGNMDDNNQKFMVGLKAFICRSDESGKKVLILQESAAYKNGGQWELPGGRILESETKLPLEEILQREISEELGDDIKLEIGGVAAAWRRYTHPDSPVFLVGFSCIYKGGEIKLSDEHMNFAWIELKDVNKYVFVEGYKEIIEKFLRTIE